MLASEGEVAEGCIGLDFSIDWRCGSYITRTNAGAVNQITEFVSSKA